MVEKLVEVPKPYPVEIIREKIVYCDKATGSMCDPLEKCEVIVEKIKEVLVDRIVEKCVEVILCLVPLPTPCGLTKRTHQENVVVSKLGIGP